MSKQSLMSTKCQFHENIGGITSLYLEQKLDEMKEEVSWRRCRGANLAHLTYSVLSHSLLASIYLILPYNDIHRKTIKAIVPLDSYPNYL